MTKNDIEQTVAFNSTAHEVFDMLMDEKKHAEFTGAPASISREVGGEFSVWGGYATGENIELIPDKKIVQTWRASDWPEGMTSKVAFELKDKNNMCELKFFQTGVPEEFIKDIRSGWKDNYWDLIKNYLKK